MRKACAQAVYGLRTVLAVVAGLWTGRVGRSLSPVYESPTYTSRMPVFVLALVHRFFDQSTDVTGRLIHLIHTTNKDQYKYKLRITQ